MNLFKKMWAGISGKKFYNGNVISSNLYSLIEGGSNISPAQAIYFYKMVAPVFTAVELIANGFASIQPHIIDNKSGDIVDDKYPDFFNLLRHPNADITQIEYMKALASYYLITGNTYTVATGDVNRQPLEIYIGEPQGVNIQMSNKDMFPLYYNIYSQTQNLSFERQENTNGLIYYTKDKLKQIWHIKNFSTDSCSYYGLSKLQPIFYEIKQYLQSNIHNLSLLEKGARLSGLLVSKTEIGQNNRDYVRQQFSGNNQGASNAGSIAFIDGADIDFKELSLSNKDMDFRELKNDMVKIVALTLGIPLPLISNEAMTMNNYKEAKLALFDDSILPHTKRIYGELENFLFPRFKIDSEKYDLIYNENEISALSIRKSEEIKIKKDSNVLTINEIRALYGYEPIMDGDKLYQPFNLVPLGTGQSLLNAQKASREKFYNIMVNYKDEFGNRLYNDIEIKDMADKYNLG